MSLNGGTFDSARRRPRGSDSLTHPTAARDTPIGLLQIRVFRSVRVISCAPPTPQVTVWLDDDSQFWLIHVVSRLRRVSRHDPNAMYCRRLERANWWAREDSRQRQRVCMCSEDPIGCFEPQTSAGPKCRVQRTGNSAIQRPRESASAVPFQSWLFRRVSRRSPSVRQRPSGPHRRTLRRSSSWCRRTRILASHPSSSGVASKSLSPPREALAPRCATSA